MKIAFISGSGKIGRTGNLLARFLAQNNILPLLHYHSSQADCEQTLKDFESQNLQSHAYRGDLSELDQCQSVSKQVEHDHEKIDILIHTVGNYYNNILESNFVSAQHLVASFLPLLKKSANGRILFFGAAGLNQDEKDFENPNYMQAKLKLLAYAKQLAIELIPDHITVNMVSPGEMDYSILNRDDLPMGRPIQFLELAEACSFFLKDSSSSITGQNLEVAGGFKIS